MAIDLAAVFGPRGPLAEHLPAYRYRPQQVAMAEAIAQAIAQRGQLMAEAGTGTGKTFAYLVPALLSGKRVVISTGTRTLQDQLFNKDLPLVAGAIGLVANMISLTLLVRGRQESLNVRGAFLEVAADGRKRLAK